MFEKLILEATKRATDENWTRKDIISMLFADNELKHIYVNEIRRATIVGQITNEVLKRLGNNDICKILAIGDIKYFDGMNEKWNELTKNSLCSIDPQDLIGYDLSGQGSQKLRQRLIDYMGNYYNLTLLDANLIETITPTYGGTDAFVSILESVRSLYSDKKIKFIYPEASFMANVKIAESVLGLDSLIKVDKPSENDFFLSKDSINKIEIGENIVNTYYITPVGNPSGEKIDSADLYTILSYIKNRDGNAIFIFDSVYVGLLIKKEAEEMFSKIFLDKKILNSSIFAESLSKTLGTTGIRVGWIWTLNEGISNEIKKTVILRKAGFSKILDGFTVNLLEDMNEVIAFQNEVYTFWSSQRIAFTKYIKDTHGELFDFESSPKINEREGIYTLLKLKSPMPIEEVFSKTGIIGVGIPFSDGVYIRYAFGNVKYF